MPEQTAVLEEIQREIKGFGDNVTGLKASLEKDLADVRKVAEEAKGAIGPEVKAQISVSCPRFPWTSLCRKGDRDGPAEGPPNERAGWSCCC